MKLLFVDDSKTVCAIYSALLEKAGYEVLVAYNMADALVLARAEAPQLGIIDFFMPEGNGDELTRALLEDPTTANIIVAIHSQFPDVVEKTLAAGAVELIGKDDPHNLFLMRVEALRRLAEGMAFRRDMVGSMRSGLHEQEEQSIRVLLVDDSPTILAVYGHLLSEQGYEVETAASIATAEQAARKFLPHLAIIDYMLPDGHGDELVGRLLANHETEDVLMVMFSQRKDVKGAALDAGAIDLIYKEDSHDIFLRRIASLKRYINAQQMQQRIMQKVQQQENKIQLQVHDLERVKHEKRFVDRLLSAIPIGLLVVGRGRILTANHMVEGLFGMMPLVDSQMSQLLEQRDITPPTEVEGDFHDGEWPTFECKLPNGLLLRIHRFLIKKTEEELLSTVESRHDEVMLWMFEDITQLRRAEEQEQFSAFQSGLVEMSSTILHNIGNALTAVTGAIWRMEEGITELNKVGEAMRAVSELVEKVVEEPQETALEGGAIDPRLERVNKILQVAVNKVLPHALERLAEEGMRPIQLSIQHITEIIQVQQGAARPESMNVACDLNKVVEDVLVMQATGLKRAEIEVEQAIPSEVGEPELPRNQLLQAVNNLIKNSFESIMQQKEADSALRGRLSVRALRVDEGGETVVHFVVADNGVGMSEALLTEVLTFGFTTKSKGSGFGLHATVNFIESIGGRVRIESPGEGLGATVTLVLPLEARPTDQRRERNE